MRKVGTLKELAKGVVSVAAVYFIFSMNLSSPMKNLILGLLCAAIALAYLVAAQYRSRSALAPATLALAAPTFLWLALLALNVWFGWDIPTLVLWATYALLTLCGFILSAWFEPVEPVSE
jgi:hypothetical protein